MGNHTYQKEKMIRWQPVFLFFVYCAILFIIYAKYYFSDQLLVSWDGILGVTDFSFVKNAIIQGELPFWNKFLAGGVPFTPNYSPVLLLSFLPVKQIFYALYIGIVAWGSVSAYLYFKRIGCTHWASVAVSICYLLSIHLGGLRKEHTSLIYTIALLPVILNLIEHYFEEKRLRWLLTSSSVMALQFCIGFPQQVVYTDLFVGLYLIAFGVHYRMKIKQMLFHGLAWIATYFGLIVWKAAPMIEQMRVYSMGGANSTIAFDTFTSYSVHPVKLVQTVFPKFFGIGNYYSAFGYFASSGVDIELFLGHMFVVFFFVGVIYLVRQFRVRFFLMVMLISFLYSAMGWFPKAAKILYHIPLLNGFRVPARALFLFLFSAFTIVAITLTEMKSAAFRKKVFRFAFVFWGIVLLGTGVAVFSAVMVTGLRDNFDFYSFRSLAEYVQECLFPDSVWMLICLLILWFAVRPPERLKKSVYRVTCAAVIVLTFLETSQFTFATQSSNTAFLQLEDLVSRQLKQELGNGKVWDAGIDGLHNSIISLNRSTSKEIPALNAYMAFNNPRLCRMLSQSNGAQLNSSGVLMGSIYADDNLHLQNALLSMLGVEYIIDSSDLLATDTSTYRLSDESLLIAEQEEIEIPYLEGEVSMYVEPFQAEPETYYEVSALCSANSLQEVYFDLYGGEAYDNPEQQVTFLLVPGDNELNAVIDSGDMTGTVSNSIYWRIVSLADEDLTFTDVTIMKPVLLEKKNTYQYWSDDWTNGDAMPIYRNTKARDILYIPDRIERIQDEEDLYLNNWQYNLDTVNYSTEDVDRVLSPEAVQITDIDFGYNQITAHVSSPEDTFVNFSQCWYPGWHAYVNGYEVSVQRVNELIMGAEVPAGESDISFRYIPSVFYIGLLITGTIGIGLLVALLFTERRKHGRLKSSAR